MDIRPYERNVATKIIEDFMLVANETVAEDYFWQEIPFVYRTHENPDEEKIQKLSTFINNFGYSMHIAKDEVHPKRTAKAVRTDRWNTRRTFDQPTDPAFDEAGKVYGGLYRAFWLKRQKYYCHFTSPIRRYPDLQIHRIIKENLRGRMNDTRKAHYEKILPEVALHASKRERLAEEAERETDKLKKVEHMSKHIERPLKVSYPVLPGMACM